MMPKATWKLSRGYESNKETEDTTNKKEENELLNGEGNQKHKKYCNDYNIEQLLISWKYGKGRIHREDDLKRGR